VNADRIALLKAIAKNASVARPDEILEQEAAKELSVLAKKASSVLQKSQSISDLEAFPLRKKAQQVLVHVKDPYLKQLFAMFEVTLRNKN